jgi:hypothetical protein
MTEKATMIAEVRAEFSSKCGSWYVDVFSLPALPIPHTMHPAFRRFVLSNSHCFGYS